MTNQERLTMLKEQLAKAELFYFDLQEKSISVGSGQTTRNVSYLDLEQAEKKVSYIKYEIIKLEKIIAGIPVGRVTRQSG